MKSLTTLVLLLAAGRMAVAQNNLEKPHNYIVVIGAFSVKGNADKLAGQARKQKLQPQVELNRIRNLYYVFVSDTDDRETAIQQAGKFRDEGKFKDAWVYLDGPKPEAKVEVVEPVKLEPVAEPKVEVVAEVKKPAPVDSAKLKEDKIKAEVAAKTMTIKRGELERLNNLYFYKDAAVLRPESKYEVDRLVAILKKNPTEKIRIHGHTNGNSPGKIIKRDNDDSDFFSLENTVEDYGSAKELSELRANLIKQYLISKGIDKKRMEIKAWGGKKPLFGIDDDKAEANVRVEIEVLNP